MKKNKILVAKMVQEINVILELKRMVMHAIQLVPQIPVEEVLDLMTGGMMMFAIMEPITIRDKMAVMITAESLPVISVMMVLQHKILAKRLIYVQGEVQS